MLSRALFARSATLVGSSVAKRSIVASRSLKTLTATTPAKTIAIPRTISLVRYSSTAARPVEVEEDAEAEQAVAEPKKEVKLIPFDTLRGYVNSDTLKALTFKPFQLSAMSEVQRRVLRLMPYLAGGDVASVARQKEVDGVLLESSAVESEEGLKRGREDLLVKAKTGTGKTLAFLVPAIEARINKLNELKQEPDEDGQIPDPSAQGQKLRALTRSHVGTLIISPTRELATQIANEALKVCTWHKEMQVRLFVGGVSRGMQLRDWRRGRKDIVVATPGRLRDLLSEPDVAEAFSKTDVLILDEADTLLEMGFSNDLNFIVDHLPKDRQTFLFSATVSKEIAAIARKTLKPNHQVIDCVPKNETNTHLHIPQYFTKLPSAKEQIPHILRLIAHDQLVNPKSKVIVFLPTTKLTMLFATLVRELLEALPQSTTVHEIHSRLDQNQRSRASERFRRDKEPSVLITSDVSARGVDYPNVTRVIQVGVPSSADQYIHRVGRTGRGGREGGRGDLVLLPWEANFVRELKEVPIKSVSADELAQETLQLASDKGMDGATERLEGLSANVDALIPSLDSAAIEEVFTSMIGYYLSKTRELSRSGHEILESLQEWTTDAVGLPQPPYLSPNFLSKLGLSNNRGPSRGGSSFGYKKRDHDGGFKRAESRGFAGDGFKNSRGGWAERAGREQRGRPTNSFGNRESYGNRGSYGNRESFGNRDSYGNRTRSNNQDRSRSLPF